MKWFGEDWGAAVCEGEHLPVPVGEPCARCGELFESCDAGLVLSFVGAPEEGPSTSAYHKLCLLASIVPVTVHCLREGFPVCGFSREVPARWPHWHFWTDRRAQVNCPGCVARMGAAS